MTQLGNLVLIFSSRTSVAGAFLHNPETGLKVPVTSDDRITYNIKIKNGTRPSGYRIEVRGCLMYRSFLKRLKLLTIIVFTDYSNSS